MNFYGCTVAVVGGVGLPSEGEGVTSSVGVTKWVELLCVLRKFVGKPRRKANKGQTELKMNTILPH